MEKNDSVENIGSDQAQIEKNEQGSIGRCEDIYDETQQNHLFDIDKQIQIDQAQSDGEDESPGKMNEFGQFLAINNGMKLDEGRTAKKPRGSSFMVSGAHNQLTNKLNNMNKEDVLQQFDSDN